MDDKMRSLENIEEFGLSIALRDYAEKSKNETLQIEEYFSRFKNTDKLGLKHSIDMHLNRENRTENLIFFINFFIREKVEFLKYYSTVNTTWINASKRRWESELHQLEELKDNINKEV